jgi:hypothetical protein
MPLRPLTAHRFMLALLLPAASGLALACGACSKTEPNAQQTQAIEQVNAACVEAMLRSTCKVMTGPPSSSAGAVFVAGVGPVDAVAYRELRASGDAMCSTVKSACVKDWEGAQCKTARSLWSVVPPR